MSAFTLPEKLSELYLTLGLTDEDFINIFACIDWHGAEFDTSEEFIEIIKRKHKYMSNNK